MVAETLLAVRIPVLTILVLINTGIEKEPLPDIPVKPEPSPTCLP